MRSNCAQAISFSTSFDFWRIYLSASNFAKNYLQPYGDAARSAGARVGHGCARAKGHGFIPGRIAFSKRRCDRPLERVSETWRCGRSIFVDGHSRARCDAICGPGIESAADHARGHHGRRCVGRVGAIEYGISNEPGEHSGAGSTARDESAAPSSHD